MPTWLRVVLFVANAAGIFLGLRLMRSSDSRALRVVGVLVVFVCAVAVGFRLGEGF